MDRRSFPVRGRYEGDNYTIDDVIRSLGAQKVLIAQAVRFLEHVDDDFDARKIVIRVVSIEEGSLLWDLMVEIWGTYQDPLTEKVTGSIEEAFGVDVPEAMEPLVALATLAVIYWGLRFAYDRVSKRHKKEDGKPLPAPIHIEGNYNHVVQIIAAAADTSGQAIERALDRSVYAEGRKVAKAATEFIAPAKRNGNQRIFVEGAPPITEEVVKEVPSEAELSQTSTPMTIPLDDVALSIRGTDRDSKASGWRAFIDDDDRFPKRLSLILGLDIDPEELANHAAVRADVDVEGDESFDGAFVAKRIHLKRFSTID